MQLITGKSNYSEYKDMASVEDQMPVDAKTLLAFFEKPLNWPLIHQGLLLIEFLPEVEKVQTGSAYYSRKPVFVVRDKKFKHRLTEEAFELKKVEVVHSQDNAWKIVVDRDNSKKGFIFKQMKREISCTPISSSNQYVYYRDAFYVDLAFPFNLFFIKPFFINNTIKFILAKSCHNLYESLSGKSINYQPSVYAIKDKKHYLSQSVVLYMPFHAVQEKFSNKADFLVSILAQVKHSSNVAIKIEQLWDCIFDVNYDHNTISLEASGGKAGRYFKYLKIMINVNDQQTSTELSINLIYKPVLKVNCFGWLIPILPLPSELHYQVLWPVLDGFINNILNKTKQYFIET
ncbi:hypothetical protein L3V83_11720 [Thiotrichales bacterium 19X7-9]|nr:hypothetical protein [Thiotrichales bacterium 19X7-9]